MNIKNKDCFVMIMIAVSMCLTACSGGSSSNGSNGSYTQGISKSNTTSESFNTVDYSENSSYYDATYTEDESNNEQVNNYEQENDGNAAFAEKLVYETSVEIETKDYDAAYANLKDIIHKYEGIIESEQFDNNNGSYLHDEYYYNDTIQRELNITVRIPTKNYETFNNENEGNGNVISKTSNIKNITEQYYSTTATLEGLQVQLSRLQNIMRQTTSVEDLITLNKEISDLEMQINNMTNEIRVMDMDVAYSYIYITLKEVVEYTEQEEKVEDTFVNRLKDQIENTWEGFLAFCEWLLFTLIALIPTLVILLVLYLIIKLIFRKKIKTLKEQKRDNRKLKELIQYNEDAVVKNNDMHSDKNDDDVNQK